MTTTGEAQPAPADATIYHEPARSFVSAIGLFVVLLAGYLVDLLVLGGAGVHIIGWALAAVIVVGADLLTIHAARGLRSITVTTTHLVVGEESLLLSDIIGFDADVDPSIPVVGCPPGGGLPRGAPGLALRLADDSLAVIPTRNPDRLARALGLKVETADVRAADADELALLPDIDLRAESLFRVSGIDLPEIPFPDDAMHDAKAIFVVGRPPVGFVRVDEVDGLAHIEELAVIPGRMRRGFGTALVEAACAWAREHGYPAVTLITFADVAWNGPFYAARGFVEVEEITPEVAELRDWEAAIGLDALGRRIVMRREV